MKTVTFCFPEPRTSTPENQRAAYIEARTAPPSWFSFTISKIASFVENFFQIFVDKVNALAEAASSLKGRVTQFFSEEAIELPNTEHLPIVIRYVPQVTEMQQLRKDLEAIYKLIETNAASEKVLAAALECKLITEVMGEQILKGICSGAHRFVHLRMLPHTIEAVRGMYKAVGQLSLAEKEGIIENTLKLTTDTTNISESLKTLNVIKSISSRQRNEVTTLVHLSEKGADIRHDELRRNLVRAVAKISDRERKNVITNAVKLISFANTFNERIEIIEAVAKVPGDIRDEVISQALRIITPDMKFYTRASIVTKIASIPDTKRAEVIDAATQLIAKNMNIEERVHILEKTAEFILVCENGDAIKNTLQFITSGTVVFDRLEMLRVFVGIPTESSRVAELAEKVIQGCRASWGGFHEESKRAIIRAVANIPVDERENVIVNALRLINDASKVGNKRVEITAQERIEIIQAVAKISTQERYSERDQVITQALRVITAETPAFGRRSVVEKIAAIAPDKREARVTDIISRVRSDRMTDRIGELN
jgi:hypothetical protein